jgi:hypothetical protein
MGEHPGTAAAGAILPASAGAGAVGDNVGAGAGPWRAGAAGAATPVAGAPSIRGGAIRFLLPVPPPPPPPPLGGGDTGGSGWLLSTLWSLGWSDILTVLDPVSWYA